MSKLRQSLPTCFSEKKKDKSSGWDEDDNEGGDGENYWRRFGKYDEVTAGYTSANDAVHNAGSKRQGKRVEERRINQGNRECSGISIKNNIYVPPKSTSQHSRSRCLGDSSGGTDDNKNGGDGGGGGSGSNNKDQCSGGAGFGSYGYGYHDKAFALVCVPVESMEKRQHRKRSSTGT